MHVGRVEREGHDNHNFEAFTIVEIILHPNYEWDEGWENFDAALLVLGSKSTSKAPIELRTDEDCFEQLGCGFGTALGWGQTDRDDEDSRSDNLQEVKVLLKSRRKCRDQYGQKLSGIDFITEAMVCAGGFGKDACKADSGGPLIVAGKLAGIISWGDACGTMRPGVYTSVAAISTWIIDQLDAIERVSTAQCNFLSLFLSNDLEILPLTVEGFHLPNLCFHMINAIGHVMFLRTALALAFWKLLLMVHVSSSHLGFILFQISRCCPSLNTSCFLRLEKALMSAISCEDLGCIECISHCNGGLFMCRKLQVSMKGFCRRR